MQWYRSRENAVPNLNGLSLNLHSGISGSNGPSHGHPISAHVASVAGRRNLQRDVRAVGRTLGAATGNDDDAEETCRSKEHYPSCNPAESAHCLDRNAGPSEKASARMRPREAGTDE